MDLDVLADRGRALRAAKLARDEAVCSLIVEGLAVRRVALAAGFSSPVQVSRITARFPWSWSCGRCHTYGMVASDGEVLRAHGRRSSGCVATPEWELRS